MGDDSMGARRCLPGDTVRNVKSQGGSNLSGKRAPAST